MRIPLSLVEAHGFSLSLFHSLMCMAREELLLGVDHLFRLGVNVMYHEAMYLVVQHILKTYGSAGQILPPTRLSMYSECPLPCVG
jgi:hypothetical protein